MKLLTCVAIDDDPLFLRKLEALADEIQWLQLLGTFKDPVKATEFIGEKQPDFVFLDIEMPYVDGYRVLDWILPRLEPNLPKIVMITGNINLIENQHIAVALTLYKLDLNTPKDLESSLIRLVS